MVSIYIVEVDKMPHQVTEKSAITLEPYKSIINLLVEFPQGLEPMHFRYALIHDGGELSDYSKDKCKRHFTKFVNKDAIEGIDILSQLYTSGKVTNTHITSKVTLTYYLHKLESLDIIFKDKRFSKPHYKIVDRFHNLRVKLSHMNRMQKIASNHIIIFGDYHALYGLTGKAFYSMGREFKSNIQDNLETLDYHLEAMNNLLIEITDKFIEHSFNKWTIKLKGILKKLKIDDFSELLQSEGTELYDFYILCSTSKIPDEYCGIKISDKFKKHIQVINDDLLQTYGREPSLYVFDLQLPIVPEQVKVKTF